MDYRKHIQFTGETQLQDLSSIPVWARSEHMEMSVAESYFWNGPDSSDLIKNTLKGIVGKLRTFMLML